VIYFNVPYHPSSCLEERIRITKVQIQDSWPPSRGSNTGPTESEAVVLLAQLVHLHFEFVWMWNLVSHFEVEMYEVWHARIIGLTPSLSLSLSLSLYRLVRGYLQNTRLLALYEGVSKSFRTDRLERELQMLQLSATRCTFIAILWVSLMSFVAITLCVASQRVFIVVSVYFIIDSVRKVLNTPSYFRRYFQYYRHWTRLSRHWHSGF
jgi:hypothetical protein